MLKSLALGVVIGTILSLVFGRLAGARKARVEPAARVSAVDETPPSPTAARGDEEDLERLTRPELYRRAKEAGIAGRSEMSKAQLIAALRAGRSGPH